MLGSVALIILLAIFSISCIVLFPPYWFIELIAGCYPSIVWTGSNKVRSSNGRRIFLTIDDAPSGDRTLQILALLERYKAKATFFCIGSHIQKFPEETCEILRKGHSIANHTMYDRKSINLPTDLLEQEVVETESLIETTYLNSNTPARPLSHRFFRPGHGFFNESLLSIIHKRGLRCVLGSLYPLDPQIRIWWVIAAIVKLRVLLSPNDANHILILHDHPWGPKVLGSILPFLKSRGFEILSLDAL